MRVLFLPNWTVFNLETDNLSLQAPDKNVKGVDYWFFRYFSKKPDIDIIDIRKDNILHKLEVNLKFYIWQGILAFRKQNEYDMVISHGAQSGVMLALMRRVFGKGKAKHVIFDIGGMNGARSSGLSTSLIKFAMKTKPWIICHSTNVIDNIRRNYPLLLDRTTFIPFGIGLYQYTIHPDIVPKKEIFVFAGKKRDTKTVSEAWNCIVKEGLDNGFVLNMVGTSEDFALPSCTSISRLEYYAFIKKLEQSSFVILPLENFGYSYGQMSLLGSLALGKRVIASNVSGISDYLPNCPSVSVVTPNDVNSMKAAIIKKINENPKLFNPEVPRREVEQNFNEVQMALRIEKFLTLILSSQ